MELTDKKQPKFTADPDLKLIDQVRNILNREPLPVYSASSNSA